MSNGPIDKLVNESLSASGVNVGALLSAIARSLFLGFVTAVITVVLAFKRGVNMLGDAVASGLSDLVTTFVPTFEARSAARDASAFFEGFPGYVTFLGGIVTVLLLAYAFQRVFMHFGGSD